MASLLDFTIGKDHTLYEISSAFLPGVTELLHISTVVFNSLAVIIRRNTFIVFFWFKCPNMVTTIYTFPLTFFERGAKIPDNIHSPYVNVCLTAVTDRSAYNIHAYIQHFVVLSNVMSLLPSNTRAHFHCRYVQYLQRRSILMVRTQNILPRDTVLALTCDIAYMYKNWQTKDIPMMYDNNCVILLICQCCGNFASLSEIDNLGSCVKCSCDALDILYTTRTRGI